MPVITAFLKIFEAECLIFREVHEYFSFIIGVKGSIMLHYFNRLTGIKLFSRWIATIVAAWARLGAHVSI